MTSVDHAQASHFLRAHGAATLSHPGGTLLAHLRRVAGLLAAWDAGPALQAAGLCHACYGTDGYGQALLGAGERASLAAVIGAEAESLVYLYGSCDRAAVYPRLGDHRPVVFRDRFTGRACTPPEQQVRAFAELTAANELDVIRHSPELAARHGPSLVKLISRIRFRLSDAAWQAWAGIEPAGDPA